MSGASTLPPPAEAPGHGHEEAPRPPRGAAWRESLRRVAALLRKELRQLFRDPRTRRVIFASPVLQLLLFGYAVTTDVHRVATWVVDHDRTQASRALVDALTAGGYFQVVGRSERPRDLARALDRGDALLGVEVPRGFAADVAAGRPARVQLLLDGTPTNTATVAQGYAVRIVQRFGQQAAQRRGEALAGGVELRARAWYNPGLASRAYNVPAVIGVLLMLMCLLLTAMAVVRERELGTLEQLVVSPITPGELMLGKTIPVALIALVDLALICAVAILWFRVPLRGSVAALLLVSALYVLAGLAMGLLVSTVSRTQQEAFMGMFLLFLPLVILSGFMFPVDAMPAVFRALSLLNPVRHFLEVVRMIFLKGAGLGDVLPQALWIAGMAAALLGAATWRFRRALR